MSFRVRWHGRRLHLRIGRNPEVVTATLEAGDPMTLRVDNEQRLIEGGTSEQFAWHVSADDACEDATPAVL